jgi:hypothetical protein
MKNQMIENDDMSESLHFPLSMKWLRYERVISLETQVEIANQINK